MPRIPKISAVLLVAIIISLSLLTGLFLKEYVFPKTLVVPDSYPTVQAAIDRASSGDTVLVKNGIYYEFGIYVDKPLKIMGQNPNETIISGKNEKGLYPQYIGRSIFYLRSSNIEISGLTLTQSERAIDIIGDTLNGITITRNNIINNFGLVDSTIVIDGMVTNLKVSENYIFDNINETAISFTGSYSSISNNIISVNRGAIEIGGAEKTNINDNLIDGNYFGISLTSISYVNIHENSISGNRNNRANPYINEPSYGISFDQNCSNSLIYGNSISGTSNGINLKNFLFLTSPQSSGCAIFLNNFFNNTQNAHVEHLYSSNIAGLDNGTVKVSWDNGTVGNYWSDYNSQGNYTIDNINVDHHPLSKQVDISVQAPTPTQRILPLTFAVIIAIVVDIVVAIGLLIYFKKHKHKVV